MIPKWPTILWRPCTRRPCAGVTLAAYLVAALGIPLPTSARLPFGGPAACHGLACGCASVEECRHSCCCSGPAAAPDPPPASPTQPRKKRANPPAAAKPAAPAASGHSEGTCCKRQQGNCTMPCCQHQQQSGPS